MRRLIKLHLLLALALMLLGSVACELCPEPSAKDAVNASDEELKRACYELYKVRYDYHSLDPLSIGGGGRILEVAAAIHADHAGPVETGKYCRTVSKWQA